MCNIGYDLDGVICKEPFYLSILFSINAKLGVLARNYQKILYKPLKIGYIITGRPECDRTITERWLKKFSIDCKLLLMNPVLNIDEVIKFKAFSINRLNIDTFIESELEQIEELINLCPNCSFFLPSTAGNFLKKE